VGKSPIAFHLTSYLPGELVEGTPAKADPDVYRQAGELLARLQAPTGISGTYAGQALAGVTRRLAGAAGLVPGSQLAALRERAARCTPRPGPFTGQRPGPAA
jgi:hypothetical protein